MRKPTYAITLNADGTASAVVQLGELQATLTFTADVPDAIGLTIQPADANAPLARGITTGVLRDIPLTEIAQAARKALDDAHGIGQNTEALIDTVRQADSVASGLTPEYLSALSWAYVQLAGVPNARPIQILADGLGKNPGTLKNHIREARKRDYLTSPSTGYAGGELTSLARKTLSSLIPKDSRSSGQSD
ncbi:hypothetical protein [Longispora urticae]